MITPARQQQSEKWIRSAIKFTNAVAYQRWLVANGHRVENIFLGDDETYTIIYRADESEIPSPRIKSKRVLSNKYSVVAIGLMLVIAAVVADAALNAAGSGSTTRATAAAVADITQLPELLHGEEEGSLAAAK